MTEKWLESARRCWPLDQRHYDRAFAGEAVNVLRPDGKLLFALRPGVLPWPEVRMAYRDVLQLANKTDRRPDAAAGQKYIASGTAGYLQGKLTGLTQAQPEAWRRLQPLLRAMALKLHEHCPEQHAVLQAAAQRTPAERLIRGTAFTTATVNRNVSTSLHRDKGNLPGGFGALTVIQAGGEYTGCLLVFAKYRVAVDLRPQDLLIADNRQWHGNTALVGTGAPFERVSIIAYFHSTNRARA
jgi:hypothetical protein